MQNLQYVLKPSKDETINSRTSKLVTTYVLHSALRTQRHPRLDQCVDQDPQAEYARKVDRCTVAVACFCNQRFETPSTPQGNESSAVPVR